MAKVPGRLQKTLLARSIVVTLLLMVQLVLIMFLIMKLSTYFFVFYIFFIIISIIATVVVINKDINPAYKIVWIVPILIFPLFGGLLYMIFGHVRLPRKYVERLKDVEKEKPPYYKNRSELFENESASVINQSNYISNIGFPAFSNTQTKYLSPGEKMFEALMMALKGARHYIFLEYYIISEGKMWNSILEILEEKAEQGLDVRVLYDGFGCFSTLPRRYYKKLRRKGIKCIEFHPLIPLLSLRLNNRNHRKIAIIDGEIGFTGGINLADEYVNERDRFGHWKDSALQLCGDAVWSLTMIFLKMWTSVSGEHEDYEAFRPADPEQGRTEQYRGVVQPYANSPLDNENIAANVYLNAISRAKKTLYISSPYIILDQETMGALRLAAKSGVDVRIITPGRADKWYVHICTRSHYRQLIESDIKIYEYTPGFMHSKLFIADDEVAIIGTINLDYRSLYLQFECGVWMHNTDAVLQMSEDFTCTLGQCDRITLQSPILRRSFFKKILEAVLKLLAPLM